MKCRGACARDLPESSFQRNGRWRRGVCRDCRAGREPVDAAAIVRRYEELAAEYRSRLIRWDDSRFLEARRDVKNAVVKSGPLRSGEVELTIDWRSGEVSRARVMS